MSFVFWLPEISPCFPNPCQNGGECNSSGDSYTCKCQNGYTSENCQDGKCNSVGSLEIDQF